MNGTTKFYLPQLDGIRFLAFLLVFIHHFPSAATLFPDPHTLIPTILNKFTQFGWIGVDIFLCLSSFLLTVLLFKEHSLTGKISLKQFYIRRSLRIWPLYYLILLITFVALPSLKFLSPAVGSPEFLLLWKQHFLPYAAFFGNFSYAYYGSDMPIMLVPLWTISLEEQFYLFWPILLFVLIPMNRKWFVTTLLVMVVLSLLVRCYIIVNEIPYPAIWVFTIARLDPFAFGALLAYFYLHPEFKPYPLWALLIALVMLLIVVTSTSIYAGNTVWQLMVVACGSALLIYGLIYSPKLAKLFSFKILSWLGKISFGLYIFHDVTIIYTSTYVIPWLQNILGFRFSPVWLWCFSFILSFAITVLIAGLSYHLFEKQFLKFKIRYTIVESRPV